MAVKYINPKAKAESGIIISGKEAKKIDYFLSNKKTLNKQMNKSIDLYSDVLKMV